MKKNKYKILAIISFLLFVLFSYLVKMNFFTSFDYNTTVKIQDRIPTFYDQFLSLFSLIGSFEITFTILLVILFFNKKLLFSVVTLASFVLAHIIELIGKMFLQHPGPPFMFFRYDLPFLFPSSYVQPGSSYPSGHSLRTVFIALITCGIIFTSKRLTNSRKFYILVIAAITAIMLLSRISLGEHWTTDVIGGMLIGISFGFLSLLFS